MVFSTDDEAEAGVGGAFGMKSEGMVATVAMIDTYSTISGTDPKKGFIN